MSETLEERPSTEFERRVAALELLTDDEVARLKTWEKENAPKGTPLGMSNWPEWPSIFERLEPECTLEYAVAIQPWGYAPAPIAELLGKIGSDLERPIIPKVDDVQLSLNIEAGIVRERLEKGFLERFPMYSLNALWEQIQDSKKTIPDTRHGDLWATAIQNSTRFIGGIKFCGESAEAAVDVHW